MRSAGLLLLQVACSLLRLVAGTYEIPALRSHVLTLMRSIPELPEYRFDELGSIPIGRLRCDATCTHGIYRLPLNGVRSSIRIHPVALDRPEWHAYARFLLYHEFLHALGFDRHDCTFRTVERMWDRVDPEARTVTGEKFTNFLEARAEPRRCRRRLAAKAAGGVSMRLSQLEWPPWLASMLGRRAAHLSDLASVSGGERVAFAEAQLEPEQESSSTGALLCGAALGLVVAFAGAAQPAQAVNKKPWYKIGHGVDMIDFKNSTHEQELAFQKDFNKKTLKEKKKEFGSGGA
mmetsp:Transcript_53594/g.174412  ORF Transcript_53594/g.174412 Transcript_53594/m.174412 type:complete len:291 (+) Transcript_53594:94-966(+)